MPKKITQRQIERRQKRKAEKNSRKELSKLQKENPEEYSKVRELQIEKYEESKFRNLEERRLQVNRLKKKLIAVGIEKYVSGYERFNEIAEQFIESGENIEEDIHIEEIGGNTNGVYLVVNLNVDKTKDCSITTKNLNMTKQTMERLKKI